jgi:hypothetical protein
MILPKYIVERLINNYYEHFQITITQDISTSRLVRTWKGKIISAQVVGNIRAGKATLIKTGDNFFVYQSPQDSTLNTRLVTQNNEVFISRKVRREIPADAVIVLILSNPIPLNIDSRNLILTDEQILEDPYIQVVEDIYALGGNEAYSGLNLNQMRIDGNGAAVTEPYLSFFNFLQSGSTKSFVNHIAGLTSLQDENLVESSFIPDSEDEIKRKAKVLESIFPNNNLQFLSNVKFIIGTKVNNRYPYSVNPAQITPSSDNEYKPQDFILNFVSNYLNKKVYLVVFSNLKLPQVDFPVNVAP